MWGMSQKKCSTRLGPQKGREKVLNVWKAEKMAPLTQAMATSSEESLSFMMVP